MNDDWRHATLFALLVTVPLWMLGGLWAWLRRYAYPEGLVTRLLVTWVFTSVVLTAGIVWDTRRRR